MDRETLIRFIIGWIIIILITIAMILVLFKYDKSKNDNERIILTVEDMKNEQSQ